MRYVERRERGAVTLAELLLVVVIIGLLFIIAAWNWRNQIGRGYDARRKSDLARIKIAFEDYYNDNECYPLEGTLNNCGGDDLKPYMAEIPCDPTKKTPYVYLPDDPDGCNGYRVLAALEDESDPDIGKVGCSVQEGCGYYVTSYNYGISAGGPVFGYIGPPLGGPETGPYFACDPSGICNSYGNPQTFCSIWWNDLHCMNLCGIAANRCSQ